MIEIDKERWRKDDRTQAQESEGWAERKEKGGRKRDEALRKAEKEIRVGGRRGDGEMTDEDMEIERIAYTGSGNECHFNEALSLSLYLHCSFSL